MREVEFLGVVIGPEGIKMEKEKVKEVLEWPMPKCIKDVQKFLGLANYYCRFIEGFATVARPLLSRSLTVDFILFSLLTLFFTFLFFSFLFLYF